jgi:hypothetical protein
MGPLGLLERRGLQREREMKPHIVWMQRSRMWACYTPSVNCIVGMGFSPRGAYEDWKYSNDR